MYSTNFYTVRTNGREIIRDHKSEFQVKIFELNDALYLANDKEFTFYGVDGDKNIVFQTVNSKAFDLSLIAYALSWYVDYSEQPTMQISAQHPQLHYKLKIA